MDLPTEWVKPSGARLMLNNEEATTERAEKLGWKRFSGTAEGIAEAEEILMARELRAEATVEAAEAAKKDGKTKKSA